MSCVCLMHGRRVPQVCKATSTAEPAKSAEIRNPRYTQRRQNPALPCAPAKVGGVVEVVVVLVCAVTNWVSAVNIATQTKIHILPS